MGLGLGFGLGLEHEEVRRAVELRQRRAAELARPLDV